MPEHSASTPTVILLCGVAGSGKTTYSQQLELQGFVRLSIDEEVWETNGRFGVDYAAENYGQLSGEAEDRLRNKLVALLHNGTDVVVDFSFWQKQRRERYRQLIESNGGICQLIYLKATPAVVTQRLNARNSRRYANAAFPIDAAMIGRFFDGFEEPDGEGETVVEQL